MQVSSPRALITDVRDGFGRTPLHLAAQLGNTFALGTWLLEMGAGEMVEEMHDCPWNWVAKRALLFLLVAHPYKLPMLHNGQVNELLSEAVSNPPPSLALQLSVMQQLDICNWTPLRSLAQV